MSITTIVFLSAVIVFVLLALVARFKWKNLYLDTLQMNEGETVLFNDEKVKVELRAGTGVDVLPGAYVRVTDSRIIIAQKVLGREKYIIKYIIHHWGDPVPEGPGGGSFNTGYITYRTTPQKISINDEDRSPIVRIEPLEKGIGIPAWLHIKTADPGQYRRALNI